MCITRGSTAEGWSHSRSVASTATSSVFIQLVDVKISAAHQLVYSSSRARATTPRFVLSPRGDAATSVGHSSGRSVHHARARGFDRARFGSSHRSSAARATRDASSGDASRHLA